ncbi:hypothetical protein GL263_15450 [Streptomyces durbertensis]|uniref:Uncharacterized protein n=1 Tax=Streptomyces durbertensis TaxID=2448886 RepID=A0ABR6EHZ3_9ACTN|nr:hypothetical protein [Streptomyces durbertensis]MBB1244951.1 hypothetical protein [Streptomyces durbertensis]
MRKPPAAATLEQLAAEVSCDLTVNVDASEVRQGVCGSGKSRFVLATFTSAGGQRAWLDEAKPYGGTYLVGSRWLAVGEPAELKRLRGRLGGTVERGDSHDSGRHSGTGHHH